MPLTPESLPPTATPRGGAILPPSTGTGSTAGDGGTATMWVLALAIGALGLSAAGGAVAVKRR
jgi:hypothetical protein